MTTGLRQFDRFFSAHQRKLLERESVAEHGLILERLSRAKSLEVVEGRVSPPERGAVDLVPWVLGYDVCRRRGELRKFGLVIHFKKQEEHDDEGRHHPYLRHARIRRQTRTNAFQFYRLLRTPHPVVPFIVGIDAVSLEVEDKIQRLSRGICRPLHGGQEHRWAEAQQRVLADVNRHIGSDDAFKLLGRYWYNREVRRVGDEILPVDMEDQRKLWLQVCREAQAKIQKRVRERQLVVEVNPTINRVIGPMGRLAEHHIFRMTLDEERHHLQPSIRVTVNTDDPGVVDTSLMHEYYLLGENLLKNEVPETRVEEWLEWLRKNGSDFSFLSVLPDSPEDPRYKHLDTLLENLRRTHPRLSRRVQGLPPRYRPRRPRPRRPPG